MYFSLWGAFNVVLFNTVIFLMLISHLRAVISDPGIVPLPKTSIDFSDMHSAQKKDRVKFTPFAPSAEFERCK